jgi:dienelactone hydrolase
MRSSRKAIEISTPGERVPGLLTMPSGARAMPAALLLHGLSSTKERMADSIGRALAQRGNASHANDLPLHGEREGDIRGLTPLRPFAVLAQWKLAVTDAIAALDYLAEHRDIDGSRLALFGYSLGAFLSVQLASDDARVEAVVLTAGGDLPDGIPLERIVRGIADPVKAIRRMNKPVLMINGQFDRTVTPEQARRLHQAAREPKTVRWYRGGHWPPQPELEAAADWVAELFGPPLRKAI